MVTLTQLRTFLAVAETGSVRAAAEHLVVTEPAVSSAVAALQKELELALVAKDGRGLRLTDAGEVYAGYARRVLGLLDEARSAAAGEAGGGLLRVAAVTTAGEQLLPALLAGFAGATRGSAWSSRSATGSERCGWPAIIRSTWCSAAGRRRVRAGPR